MPALNPNPHARVMDAEETTQGEGQQRCSPSQLEAGWAGPFHQLPRVLGRFIRPSHGVSHLCRDLAGCPAGRFGLIPELIPPTPTGGGARPGLGLALCPQGTVRGEEAGKSDPCLSGG